MPVGDDPTVTVVTTVCAAGSITDTVPSSGLVRYTRAPPGSTATPKGLVPSGIVERTAFVSTSTTETLPSPEFATYATGAADAGRAAATMVATVAATHGQFGLNRIRLFRNATRSAWSLDGAVVNASRAAVASPPCSMIASVRVDARPSWRYGAVLPTPHRVRVRNTDAPVPTSSTASARPGPMSWRLRSP